MSDTGAVVVVGGTRSIGLEIVRHYASRGLDVVLTGVTPATSRRPSPRRPVSAAHGAGA